MEVDPTAVFRSSLAPNGYVTWSNFTAPLRNHERTNAGIDLDIRFSNIDWASLQAVYGWAALQFQAWARGFIMVDAKSTQAVTLYTDGVLEFRVDGDHHFGGDYYGFRKAPVILHLSPGLHQLDIRLVRDVRAMGAVGPPFVRPLLELRLSIQAATAVPDQIVAADIVDGTLASPYVSVPVRNTGRSTVTILSVDGHNVSHSNSSMEFVSDISWLSNYLLLC